MKPIAAACLPPLPQEASRRKEKTMKSELEDELSALINRHSARDTSNTPDFILAQFLLRCLEAWKHGVYRLDRLGSVRSEG